MSGLDRRHRWDDGVQAGARITFTCRVCHAVHVFELLVPNALVEPLIRQLTAPNPYRTLIR